MGKVKPASTLNVYMFLNFLIMLMGIGIVLLGLADHTSNTSSGVGIMLLALSNIFVLRMLKDSGVLRKPAVKDDEA